MMCLRSCFQKFGIRSSSHLDHLVNGLKSFQGLKLPWSLEENAVVPINFLCKIIGSIPKLLGSITDLISKGCRSHHHTSCRCCHRGCMPRPRHKSQMLLQAAQNSHHNSDSKSFPCPRHGNQKRRNGVGQDAKFAFKNGFDQKTMQTCITGIFIGQKDIAGYKEQ